MLTGAFVGSEPEYYPRADALERWLGRPLDVQPIFVTWDERTDPVSRVFEEQLPAIWGADRVPLLTWEPFTDAPEATPSDVDRRIAGGGYEDYLDRWRAALRDWLAGPDGELGTADDRHCLLRFAHEANGDWYPWAPARETRPEDYVAMWRTVHRSVLSDGITDEHVRWVWAVNHVDVGEVRAEDLYPGDAFVDWAGIDGFNWGTSQAWSSWTPPEAVFDPMLDRVRSITDRPVCIPEYASSSATETGPEVAAKNRWIRDAFEYFETRPVEMALWFNIDKETDWAVFDAERGDMRVTIEGTEYAAYSAYQRMVQGLG